MKVLSVLVWTEGLKALVWPGLRQLHCCYNFINRYCLQLASVPLPRYQLNRARKSKSVKEDGDAVSGNWWFGNGSGEATLAYCDMHEPEGMVPKVAFLKAAPVVSGY